MDSKEKLDLLMRTALADTDKVFGAYWARVKRVPVYTVGEATALSIDLDPIFADFSFVTAILIYGQDESVFIDDDGYNLKIGFPILAKRMKSKLGSFETILNRYIEAVGNVEPYGDLPIVEKADKPENSKVRLTDFAIWAKKRGWDLPDEFPCEPLQIQKVSTSPPTDVWKKRAREIGLTIYAKNNKLSVDKIAKKVHEEMTIRHKNGDPNMTGRGGKILSVDTIKRHALIHIKSSIK